MKTQQVQRIRRTLFAALLAFVFAAPAAELKGVNFTDTWDAGGTKLVLNGLGLRLATIFKVSVYVAGLYVEAPAKEADAILNAKGKRVLVMRFLRDVEKTKIDESYREGFEKNCQVECADAQAELAKLLAQTEAIKKGEEMRLHFASGDVEIFIKGKSKGSFRAKGFDRALLSIWLGASPPNHELKAGLLGQR